MERAIEIRTLDGKSVAVSVAADRSIADLKARLRESFAPAKNSPNFHLFFKGAKLRLESRIDSHLIEHGDFFVFIPFTKRSRQLPLEHDPSQPSTAPSASDSAWLDLMSDLSFLSDTSRSDPSASNCNPSKHSSAGKEEREEVLMGRSFRKSSLMTMRKRKLDSSPAPENSSPSKNPSSGTVGKGEVKMGLSLSKRSLNRRCMRVADSNLAPNDCTPSKNSSDGKGEKGEVPLGGSLKMGSFNTKYKTELDVGVVLREVLCSNFNDVLEQQARDKIRQIVESVNCLSSSNMGGCVLLEEFFRMSYEKGQCMCPSWLKKVLKIFTFLNIFYAFFHMKRKHMKWNSLEEALKQPESIGLGDVNVSDVENLSLLCPEVVVILDKQENMLSKLGSAIVIGSSSIESSNQCDTDIHRTAKKQVTMSVVINAIGNRTVAFRSNLWKTIKCCMERKLSKPLMLSLEDLILMKNDIAVPEGSKVRLYVANNVYSMDPADMVEHLRQGIGKNGQIVHVEEIDAKEAVYVELPNDLSNPLRAALSDIGISRLYSHQAEAVQASLCGKNVLVATSTSSGKSLCYNLPVLEALSQNLCSCALYVFPTKALAQDQLRALLEMTRGLDIGLKIGVYDGDTSQQNRMSIRDNARLLITNPDMLHISILPYHGRFQRILSNLRYVVIDETHAYKGAFGCHTALILRRLRRICSHVYGSDPSFIFCTATSANPREHAMELASLPDLEVIQKDGSPCGPKYFILWNPPLCSTNASRAPTNANNSKTVNDEITKRSSPIWQVAYLFAEMVQHGLRCIAFCKTRKLCELVLCYTREVLLETAKDLVDSIRVYRAGYTPEDRRRIEADLFEGKLLGVAATNALELGIDVGHIDATLHLGFPGSVASLWQQAGRSGRRSKPSLAVYVAFEGPLDQYFMKFPHKLFQSPIEHCKVDAQNQKVLEQHIACAANELALCLQYDEKYFGSGLDSAIMTLKNKGYLGNNPSGVSSGKMWSYIGPEPRPSHVVSIRAIEANKFKVIDKSSNEVLEEVEESKAFFQVYEGAVYMNQGNTYLVKYLDLSARIAFCQKADLKYYTKTQDCTDIHVFGGDLAYQPVKGSAFKYARTTAQEQACKVTTKWFGFYRVWRKSNQIFDRVELTLPTYSYESRAAWIRVPESIKTTVETQGFLFREGLHAASHALLNVVPLYMMCSASDLGTDCANPHDSRAFPERILLYDKHPGGIGITAQVQLLFRDLLSAAFDLVSTCRCLASAGCPNCVQALSCSEYNEVLNKEAAIIILKGVIESEKLCFKSK